ncbi:hypothetical protein GCM10022419_122020 [Nonomuraea rosea]|uniref:Deoxyribonuclease NucA/NucB domain-containing protein n=1 Tax=Nonomuraea rosea TaxID=638574 RepID=A0ABP6ZPI8_9ACTN
MSNLSQAQAQVSTNVRCDTAWYIQNQGGCIFHKVTPYIQWNLGRTYDKAFWNYWNACTDPDGETYPAYANKYYIPGCKQDPTREYRILHRTTQVNRNSNQANTNTTCNKMWPGYSSKDGPNSYQCDEFPFASTYERSKVRMLQSNAYALCPIPTSHNRDAGGALETHFYQRIAFSWETRSPTPSARSAAAHLRQAERSFAVSR